MKLSEAIKLRVKQLAGVDIPDTDGELIRYMAGEKATQIRNNINQTAIPQGLQFVLVDMTAAAYILNRLHVNAWQEKDVRVPKSIKEGDTVVDFGDGNTNLERLESGARSLLTIRDAARYRRLKW